MENKESSSPISPPRPTSLSDLMAGLLEQAQRTEQETAALRSDRDAAIALLQEERKEMARLQAELKDLRNSDAESAVAHLTATEAEAEQRADSYLAALRNTEGQMQTITAENKRLMAQADAYAQDHKEVLREKAELQTQLDAKKDAYALLVREKSAVEGQLSVSELNTKSLREELAVTHASLQDRNLALAHHGRTLLDLAHSPFVPPSSSLSSSSDTPAAKRPRSGSKKKAASDGKEEYVCIPAQRGQTGDRGDMGAPL